MTARVLTNYAGLGEQESAGIFLENNPIESDILNAASMEKSATQNSGPLGNPEALTYEILVQYSDQTNPLLIPIYEIMEARYARTGGGAPEDDEFRWERVRTIQSSDPSNAPINFAAAGAEPNLRFLGVTSHEQYAPNDYWHVVGDAGEPTFLNDWANIPGSQPLEFKLIGNMVHIRGTLNKGLDPLDTDDIFTLPIGYRPPYLITNEITTGSADPCRVAYDVNGNVRLATTGVFGAFLVLNVSFHID